jgi:hypothetical protein
MAVAPLVRTEETTNADPTEETLALETRAIESPPTVEPSPKKGVHPETKKPEALKNANILKANPSVLTR